MFKYEYDILAVPTAFSDRDTQREFIDLFEISEQETKFEDAVFNKVLKYRDKIAVASTSELLLHHLPKDVLCQLPDDFAEPTDVSYETVMSILRDILRSYEMGTAGLKVRGDIRRGQILYFWEP